MNYFLKLECGHTIQFSISPPVKGDHIWCYRCDNSSTVVEAPEEWRVRCQGCRLARKYGRAEVTAEAMAVRHMMRTGHVVEIWDGHKLERTVERQLETLSLPDDSPRF